MANHKHTYTIVGVGGGATVFRQTTFVGVPRKSTLRERATRLLQKEFEACGIFKFQVHTRKWTRARTKEDIAKDLVRARRVAKKMAIQVSMIEHELQERYGSRVLYGTGQGQGAFLRKEEGIRDGVRGTG